MTFCFQLSPPSDPCCRLEHLFSFNQLGSQPWKQQCATYETVFRSAGSPGRMAPPLASSQKNGGKLVVEIHAWKTAVSVTVFVRAEIVVEEEVNDARAGYVIHSAPNELLLRVQRYNV